MSLVDQPLRLSSDLCTCSLKKQSADVSFKAPSVIGTVRRYPQNRRSQQELQIIAREGSNRLIDRNIVISQRTRFGNKIVYKRNALLNTIKAIKRGGVVSFLINQKINQADGVPVTFFGQETLAVRSCAIYPATEILGNVPVIVKT